MAYNGAGKDSTAVHVAIPPVEIAEKAKHYDPMQNYP
jgi:hypothetical protein